MNKQDFIKVILPVSEYYSKTLTDGLVEVYYMQVKDWDLSLFEEMIKKHIQDPSDGRYWPTIAHLVSQAGTEASVGVKAGIAFDEDPTIDGCSSYDSAGESKYDRASRRKIFIEKQKLHFIETPRIDRLNMFHDNKLITLEDITTPKISKRPSFPGIGQ